MSAKLLAFLAATAAFGVRADIRLASPFTEDGVYHPAQIDNLLMRKNVGGSYFDGEITGQDLVISAAGVDRPRHVRYLYAKPYFGHLVSEANLPLGVFHLDLE